MITLLLVWLLYEDFLSDPISVGLVALGVVLDIFFALLTFWLVLNIISGDVSFALMEAQNGTPYRSIVL